jgi:hypothetical protein
MKILLMVLKKASICVHGRRFIKYHSAIMSYLQSSDHEGDKAPRRVVAPVKKKKIISYITWNPILFSVLLLE